MIHSKMAQQSTVLTLIARIGKLLLVPFLLSLLINTGFADTTLDTIKSSLYSSTGQFGKLIIYLTVISGIGLVIAGIFKFHAHKNNPQQVPLSQGITLLLIGSALTLFPYLTKTFIKGSFGQDATVAGFHHDVPGDYDPARSIIEGTVQ
jgi:intracellular multiplication protein IcmD